MRGREEVESLVWILHPGDEIIGAHLIGFGVDLRHEFLNRADEDLTSGLLIEVLLVKKGFGFAWVQADMSREVDDILELFGWNIQHQMHTGWDGFQIPDMGAWGDELDMAHALAAEFFGDDFNAALFAGDTLVTDLLIFAAVALIVLGRTEDLFAEETTHFWFLGTIVDRFGAGDFAMAPGTDGFWGG